MSIEHDDSLFAEEVARWFLARGKKDGKLQELAERAAVFDDLKNHPAWRRLYELAVAEKESFFRGVTARMWNKPPVLPTESEVAYHQGFYQGALWLLAHPEMAEKSLYAAARAAYLLSQARGDELEESDE